jgi:hypothetical protein
MKRPILRAFAALSLAVLFAPAVAHAAPAAGAQFRYWDFSDGETMRDLLAYYAPGPFHVQLEYWDFENGEDQFRPEVGVHWRDSRRSAYTLQWRHEAGAERFWFETGQVVGQRWVANASVSPIVTDSGTDVVWQAGADVYWGSWSFGSATLIRDPRDGGLWTVPIRARFANEANDWLQLTVAPASQRSIGWAADGKWHVWRVGVERNSRYDFTTRDNIIFTFGIEMPLPKGR